jgi:hypothetical protein
MKTERENEVILGRATVSIADVFISFILHPEYDMWFPFGLA